MIKELQKTYEYLPKVQGEEHRTLTIYESSKFHGYGFDIKLEIRIDGIRYSSAHTVTNYDAIRFVGNIEDVEDTVLRELCYKISEIPK